MTVGIMYKKEGECTRDFVLESNGDLLVILNRDSVGRNKEYFVISNNTTKRDIDSMIQCLESLKIHVGE